MVAQQLLGKRFVRSCPKVGVVSGWIVEVEAYLSRNDAASHAARGLTRSNQAMFGPAGTLYVYPIHARYCLNVVTEPTGEGAAVLIRAVEPEDGLAAMQSARGLKSDSKPVRLTSGPARLCEAFRVDRSFDGYDLVNGQELWIEHDSRVNMEHRVYLRSPRIGISRAQDLPLRFFIDGNPFVSGPRRWHSSAKTSALLNPKRSVV